MMVMGQKATGPANEFSVALNNEIRAIMARRHMSQQQLVDASGISKTRISKTVFNSHAPLTTNELGAISEALGMTPLDILQATQQTLKLSDPETKSGYSLAALDEPGEPDANEEDYL